MSLLAYWVFKKLRGWMTSQQLDSVDDEDAAKELKRQAKKERKAARGPKMRAR